MSVKNIFSSKTKIILSASKSTYLPTKDYVKETKYRKLKIKRKKYIFKPLKPKQNKKTLLH